MSKLPETIIAGYQKCGTTAIYHYLKNHPGVGVARKNPETANIVPFLYNDIAYPKELNFFRNGLVLKQDRAICVGIMSKPPDPKQACRTCKHYQT